MFRGFTDSFSRCASLVCSVCVACGVTSCLHNVFIPVYIYIPAGLKGIQPTSADLANSADIFTQYLDMNYTVKETAVT